METECSAQALDKEHRNNSAEGLLFLNMVNPDGLRPSDICPPPFQEPTFSLRRYQKCAVRYSSCEGLHSRLYPSPRCCRSGGG